MHHVEGAGVTLPVGDDTNTPQVSATGHHAQVTWRQESRRNRVKVNKTTLREGTVAFELRVTPTSVKLDKICDLAGFQVDADCVVDLNEGVRVADGAGVMGHQVGDSFGADEDFLHLAQLVLQRRDDPQQS